MHVIYQYNFVYIFGRLLQLPYISITFSLLHSNSTIYIILFSLLTLLGKTSSHFFYSILQILLFQFDAHLHNTIYINLYIRYAIHIMSFNFYSQFLILLFTQILHCSNLTSVHYISIILQLDLLIFASH